MPRLSVGLPPHLKAFVDSETLARKYASAGEYVAVLIQKAQLEGKRGRVEQMLLERVDWEHIRREVDGRLE